MEHTSIRLRPAADPDWEPVTAIFNHYVATSPAAYPDEPVGVDFFADRTPPSFLFLVAEDGARVVGYGNLSPFFPLRTMRHSAVLSYFLLPEYTGHGIGQRIFDELIDAGRRQGITTFLAHLSSLNTGSLRFHLRNGFVECGRLRSVGVKNGESFDVVWMQRVEVADRG